MMIVLMALALVAGAALSSQTAINAQLAKSVGGQPLVATFISFVVGSVPLLLICLWKADWQSAFPKRAAYRRMEMDGRHTGGGIRVYHRDARAASRHYADLVSGHVRAAVCRRAD